MNIFSHEMTCCIKWVRKQEYRHGYRTWHLHIAIYLQRLHNNNASNKHSLWYSTYPCYQVTWYSNNYRGAARVAYVKVSLWTKIWSSINSLAPERYGRKFSSTFFKFFYSSLYLEYFQRDWFYLSVTNPHWTRQVNIGSCRMILSGNKPLLEPRLS